jgi:ribosomal protein S18 acetylase RimI-like enzyme
MNVDLEVHANDETGRLLAAILPVYVDVYQESPYCERLADVADFACGWPQRVHAPGFRCVVARDAGHVVGFVFGHELTEKTRWWAGALGDLDVHTTEWPGRTFAVIEMAVLAESRRAGVALAMHQQLLVPGATERVTLLVRPEPEAAPARATYERWGYRQVGQIQPGPDLPIYNAMVLDLVDDPMA